MGALPLKAQSFTIPGGLAGTQATLRMMRSVALSGAKSPTVRTLALSIIRDLPPRDTLSEAKALFQWVRDRIRFVQDVDNVETVQTTDYTLSVGQGDCDDKTDLLAALCLSVGLPFRFVVVGNDPSNFCHVLGQVQANGRWYFVEPSEPGPISFGMQKRLMPAMLTMDVSSGDYVKLAGLGDIIMQYGFDPFMNPPQYSDLTKAQWDAFYSNVHGDAHDRLVTAALQSPSLQQAFFGMVTGLSDPWINFDTDPSNPYKSQGPGSPTGTAAGKVYTGVKTKLQGLGAIPPTSWNWLYNAVKTGAAKASLAWSNGRSLTTWNQQFESQQRLATQVGDLVAVVASAVGIGEAAGALSSAGAASSGTATVAGTGSAIAPTTVAVDTSGVAASAAAPTLTAGTTIAASTLPTLSAADIGTAASTLAATAASTGGSAATAATTVADAASTIGTVTKAATALVGADLAVKTAQAQIDAQQQAQQIAQQQAVANAATALNTPTAKPAPSAVSKFLPFLIVAGIGAVAYLT